MVAYWDEHTGQDAGTQGELTVAYRRGVPVYLVKGADRRTQRLAPGMCLAGFCWL